MIAAGYEGMVVFNDAARGDATVSMVGDPRDIPGDYCEIKHAALSKTIAEPGSLAGIHGGELRIMACHETHESPCVGWLANQLEEGNNIPLRLAVINGRIDAKIKTVGEQHATLEDTLPIPR